MNRNLRYLAVLAVAAFLSGCQGPCEKIDLGAPKLGGGQADFSRYVAVGTSISAGYQSGGLVDRHQVNAFTAIFARQIGKTVSLAGTGSFSEPTVNGNGLPPLLQLRSLSGPAGPNVSNSGLTPGSPTNSTFAGLYSNLAVPGSIAFDFASTARYGTGLFPLVTRGLGTIQHQMLLQSPTFVSFEFGANEVLGPATSGTARGSFTPPTDPVTYGALIGLGLQAIHDSLPEAKVALFNVPDVTTIPFCTTYPPITQSIRTGLPSPLTAWTHRTLPAVGPLPDRDTMEVRALGPGDLVLLTAKPLLAAGFGFDTTGYNYVSPLVQGNSQPLDSAVVLDVAEQAVIANATAQLNAAVDNLALQPWVTKVDMNGLLSRLNTNGFDMGGIHYSTKAIVGGLFSLDGVHPSDLGHAILANAMIDAVNAKFGASVPHARYSDYTTNTASSAKPWAGDLRPTPAGTPSGRVAQPLANRTR